MTKPHFDDRQTVLSIVNGSVGSRAFQHLYVKRGTRSEDILRGGELSCAFFVSTILHSRGLIREVHATVTGTLKDMRASGWKRIRHPRPGAVLTWAPVSYEDQETHGHIGFAVSTKNAVSTSYRRRVVAKHSLTFGARNAKTYRPIQHIWWHEKLQ